MAGTLEAGAICANTHTGEASDMTLEEYIDFLTPKPSHEDPTNPGSVIPARAGAMCQSVDDWNKLKTALEQACRELGTRCTYELKHAIKSLYSPLVKFEKFK